MGRATASTARHAPLAWISRPSFLSIVASAIESYNREATGFLVGRPAYRTVRAARKRVTLLEAAYPLLTSDRKPTWVEPINDAAYDRALRVVHGVDVGLSVIGGFHSHPNGVAGLSEDDLSYVEHHWSQLQNRGWKLLGRRWLELIVVVRRRNVANGTHGDWYWQESGSRLRARMWMPGHERYDLMLAAFSVDPESMNGNGRPHVAPTKLMMRL